MASVNKVTLLGNVVADPEIRYTTSGDAVATVRLATSEKWTDKASGQKKEATEFHRLVAYRQLAKVIGDYVRKGSPVYFEGKLRTRKWQDQSGADRYTTEVEVFEMQLLGKRPESADSSDSTGARNTAQPSAPRRAAGPAPAPAMAGDTAEFLDDIPFVSCSLAADPLYRMSERKFRRG